MEYFRHACVNLGHSVGILTAQLVTTIVFFRPPNLAQGKGCKNWAGREKMGVSSL